MVWVMTFCGFLQDEDEYAKKSLEDEFVYITICLSFGFLQDEDEYGEKSKEDEDDDDDMDDDAGDEEDIAALSIDIDQDHDRLWDKVDHSLSELSEIGGECWNYLLLLSQQKYTNSLLKVTKPHMHGSQISQCFIQNIIPALYTNLLESFLSLLLSLQVKYSMKQKGRAGRTVTRRKPWKQMVAVPKRQ